MDATVDNDYFGLVYNYYSNRKFMVAGWKKSNDAPYWTPSRPEYETQGGMQIRVFESNSGPSGSDFKMALWNSNNVTQNQVCVRVCVCVCVRVCVCVCVCACMI